MISFAKKEKIRATLIHLEKEKFPCGAEAAMLSPPPHATPGPNARGGRPGACPLAELEAGFQRALSSLDQGGSCTQAGSAPAARAAHSRLGRGWRGQKGLPH